MAKFQFPKNPNSDRENPFQGRDGANPFGDEPAAQQDADRPESHANPYSATAESAAVQPYQPGDYETFLPNRGALVCWLGAIGFVIQLIAITVAVIASVAVGVFLDGLVYGLPGQLVGLALTIPAWIMGHSDVRAIAAGAMEDSGRRPTRWGLWLGVTGTLLGTSQLLVYFGLLIFEEFYA